MPEKIDLGSVNQMVAKVDPDKPEFVNLVLTNESGEKVTIPISRESARGLWSYLTAILYPRAAEQITTRTETVKMDRGRVPPDVAYMAIAYTNEQDPQTVEITCASREIMWVVKLTHENADDLWASLEDKLNQV